jgi:hypothetical protein
VPAAGRRLSGIAHGPAPWQVVAGLRGDTPVRSGSDWHPGQLPHLLPTGGGWTAGTGLAAAAAAAAWAEGRSMPLEQAVADALADAPDGA